MKATTRRVASVVFLVVVSLVGQATSLAQSYRGSIRGVIHDAADAVVPGASVTARSLGTGLVRSTVTAFDGAYVLTELPAGEYVVVVEAAGFAKATSHVEVVVGSDSRLDVALDPTVENTSVTVTAEIPVLNPDRDTLGAVVGTTQIEQLPLNGRDFTKLVPLVPGATVEPSGVAGTEKGFGQFNINGNRDRSNNYTLDGTDNNDPFFNNSALNQVGITGAPASLLPVDAIQEFNLQSQFGAEYGRNSGSVVNIVTKSGTNQFHGSVFEFFRNDVLDARNFFNVEPNPKTNFQNNNFGGSIGGPIVKDKAFFFFAYEGQRERVGSSFLLLLPTADQKARAREVALANGLPSINPALDQVLDFFPVPNPDGTLNYSSQDKNDIDSLIGRVDYSFNPNWVLTGRYAFSRSEQVFPLGSLGGFGSGSRIADFAQVSPTRVQVVSLSLLTAIGLNRVNEVRLGYSRYRTSFSSLDSNFDPNSIGLNTGTGETGLPEFDFAGVIENLGATAFSIPRGRVSQTWQILDNFTWNPGAHSFKFGGEFRHASVNAFNDNLGRGLFTFSPSGLDPDPVVDVLSRFYLGRSFVLANYGDTRRLTTNNGFSMFAQDDWRVTRNVTVNAGLRWDYFGPLGEERDRLSNIDSAGNLVQVGAGLDTVYERDLNNFSPRLGVAWDVRGRGTTIVRAGYGLYYDYVPQNLLIANFTSTAGVATNPIGESPVYSLRYNRAAFNGTGTGAILTPVTTPPYNIFGTDGKLITPYAQAWNLNIQYELTHDVAVEVGYVGGKGTHLVRLYDRNQPNIFGDRPDPRYGFVDILSSGACSSYNAMQAILRVNNWHGITNLTQYTWGKSLDGASDGIDFNFASAALPQDSNNLRAEKGPSTYDTRGRFSTAVTYAVPEIPNFPSWLANGWGLNSIVVAQTGRPIPIVTSNDTSSFFNFNFATQSNFHQRPNILPGVDPILANWNPSTGYLNPLAFQQPADGTFGSLGRNQIFGPGYWNVDFSVSKTNKLTEQLTMQLRVEFFNIFNHPNFALPGGTIIPGVNADGRINRDAGPAGLITQTPDVAQGNPGLGGGGPRVIQLGIRFTF